MSVTFSIQTFGCKVNRYESAAVSSLLENKGYLQTNDPLFADIVIVNSCTVTAEGDRKAAQFMRRIKRFNPASILVLCGCMPQAYPDKATALREADIVTGTGSRLTIPDLIMQFQQSHTRILAIERSPHKHFEELSAPAIPGHTRGFLKIEDGCDRCCAYCVIPKARGNVRSMDLSQLKRQVERLAEHGCRELVLSGINLSYYGRDLGMQLSDALAITASVDGIERIRLGSLEPDLLDNSLLRAICQCEKLCSHFHLALRSGSDTTLRRMKRQYTTDEYLQLARKIRSLCDNPTFTTDVITGFPGETEEDYLESLQFVQRFGFLKVHVFPFSAREGAAASTYPDQIDHQIKHTRTKQMIEAADAVREQLMLSCIGQAERVILETPKEGFFQGYTDRYLPVLVKATTQREGDVLYGSVKEIQNGRCLFETS